VLHFNTFSGNLQELTTKAEKESEQQKHRKRTKMATIIDHNKSFCLIMTTTDGKKKRKKGTALGVQRKKWVVQKVFFCL